jgi:hypothetical protein
VRTLIETVSLTIILMLIVLAVTHTANGSFGEWISSKFQVYDPDKGEAGDGEDTKQSDAKKDSTVMSA